MNPPQTPTNSSDEAILFSARRWSFSVYPDRIRIRSKRRLLEIRFADITNVQAISYRHRLTPAVFWNKIRLNFDPRYPKYGMGQALGVITGTRRYIRIDCRSARLWRKGYCLVTWTIRSRSSRL